MEVKTEAPHIPGKEGDASAQTLEEITLAMLEQLRASGEIVEKDGERNRWVGARMGRAAPYTFDSCCLFSDVPLLSQPAGSMLCPNPHFPKCSATSAACPKQVGIKLGFRSTSIGRATGRT